MVHTSQDYIGRYRLLSQLRSGSTCQVWEVMDDTTNERFAIKLLLANFRHSREEVGFMKHEFRVGRRLNHRRVNKVHAFGADAKNVFLVMDLFPAPNLKQIIQSDFDSLAPVARNFITQAAEGLGYLHSQGWIHRDIKPDNFLMKPNGDLRLIDFALATQRRRGIQRLVAGGFDMMFGRFVRKIQGTRSYMSPEQIRGGVLDERADLYSFGCVIYEVLSGKVPFTGVSTADLLNKHLRFPPPPIQAVNRDVSDPIANLLKRMMAKQPKDRPRDIPELMRELHNVEIFKNPPAKTRR